MCSQSLSRTSSILTTIRRAVPVRPDLLGEHLDAFISTLPQIHALRMCHLFGRGSDVHITKLPVEIEQAIEELIVESWDSFDCDNWMPLGTWKEQFECFESRCEPMYHVPDSQSPLSDAVSYELTECTNCQDDPYNGKCENRCTDRTKDSCDECASRRSKATSFRIVCENSCEARKKVLMNHMAQDDESQDAYHDDACAMWHKRINQAPGGGFVKYAEVSCHPKTSTWTLLISTQVLRKHFGLAASFSNTRVANGEHDVWPKHKNHRYHRTDELQTTLCYLILHKPALIGKTYSSSEMEGDCGFVSLPAAQAMDVDLVTLTDEAKMKSRFQRALRILGLEPWMHASQRNVVLAPPKMVLSDDEEATAGGTVHEPTDERCKPGSLLYTRRSPC